MKQKRIEITKAVKLITPAQLKKLHMQLRDMGIIQHKAEIISGCTGGRTESSRELTSQEAVVLINSLCGMDDRKKEISAIWYLAYNMEMIYGNTPEDKRMNAAKIDAFCLSRGTVKKKLQMQTITELRRTHRQFERMYSAYLKTKTKQKYIYELQNQIETLAAMEEYEECANLVKRFAELKKRVKI